MLWISLVKIRPGKPTTAKSTKICLNFSLNSVFDLAVGRAKTQKYSIRNRFVKYTG